MCVHSLHGNVYHLWTDMDLDCGCGFVGTFHVLSLAPRTGTGSTWRRGGREEEEEEGGEGGGGEGGRREEGGRKRGE